MQLTVRLGDLSEPLREHLDEIEAQTGYRPNKSDVVRDALREKLGSASEPAEAEGAC
jgi:Arc/MetJ-type ribon-helix-helix transcriptional regulator